MSSRDLILDRVRKALTDASEVPEPSRDYLTSHTPDDPAVIVDLLAANLADYRARVHRTDENALPDLLARLLTERGTKSVLVPSGLPEGWLAKSDATQVADRPASTAGELDEVDSVVTGCALAIAETGTIVLDAGPDQGRRRITLVPDHHICVVRTTDQIVA
ncbi:LutC/YkgG family protein, partial [Streptomyces beijiangensis]